MTKLMQAVRTLRRIYSGPTARAMAEAHHCDRHFDGGEWSDPAHALMQDEWMLQQERTVAAAFGLDTAVLGRAFDTACHLQEQYEHDARQSLK